VEKYRVTGLVLNKIKIRKFVFFVGEEWFTLSTNVKSQSNKCWCYENAEAVREASFTSPQSAVNGHKIIRPMFFKEANSGRHVKLILTSLFRELTDEDKMYENSHYLQELKKCLKTNCHYFKIIALSCVEKYFYKMRDLFKSWRTALRDSSFQ
jgi:hypothetical protein